MYRMVSFKEIDLAQNSLRSLRSAINSAKRGAVGPEAREQVLRLTAHINVTSSSIDALRCDVSNPTVKSILAQYEQLERSAHAIASDLTAMVNYKGPIRSAMGAKEKVKYISENGGEKFLALPH